MVTNRIKYQDKWAVPFEEVDELRRESWSDGLRQGREDAFFARCGILAVGVLIGFTLARWCL
jgi:hypothetical protein